MLELDEARSRLLGSVQRLGNERVPLTAAHGRVLAVDVHASAPLPGFDHSAMDGYAVRTQDFAGSDPVTLEVAALESAAGSALLGEVPPGKACRIFTGAPIPRGADAVVMQEQVEREGDRVTFARAPALGAHIRRAGEDLPRGALAILKGARLGPGHLALLGMLDQPEVVVARRPVVVILSTGDELRAPGEAPRPGSIPESNAAPLAALAAQAGALVRLAPIARDEPAATLAAIFAALHGADVLLTVGGVSVGDHDLVRPALEQAGVTLDFWKVAIKPGKPLAVGRRGAALVLGLPGNPASAMVTLAMFGLPTIRAMQGDNRSLPMPLRARLARAHKRAEGRVELARVVLENVDGELVAKVHPNQASGAATSLAASDGIAIVHPGEGPLPGGSVVDVLRWADL